MTSQRSPIPTRFPWEKLYIGTVLEAGAARKPQRIKIAEATLVARSLELKDNAEHEEEFQAVEDALSQLGRPQAGTISGQPDGVRRRFPRLLQLCCLPSQWEHPTRSHRSIRTRADPLALCSLSLLRKGVRGRTQREKSLVCSAGKLACFDSVRCGFQGWLGV